MSAVILSEQTQSPPHPIFVGLDVSLTATGVAIATAVNITTSRVESKAPKNATTDQQIVRMQSIVARIVELIPVSDHTIVAMEGPSFGSSLSQHTMGGIWWLVRDGLQHLGVEVWIVPPSTVKKYATGSGSAAKDKVLAAVIRRYAAAVDVDTNDEADALVIAAIIARVGGHPIEPDGLPQTHLDALKKGPHR